jgi:hypothetical protein
MSRPGDNDTQCGENEIPGKKSDGKGREGEERRGEERSSCRRPKTLYR